MKNLLSAISWPVFISLLITLVQGGIAFPLHATTVEVQTIDGRVLHGEVDSRSNQRLLWIRKTDDHIVLATSVLWSNVSSAKYDGKTFEARELRQDLKQHTSDGPSMLFKEYVARPMPVIQNATKDLASHGRQASQHPVLSSRIASIRVRAQAVNLDRDVEPDGLEVAVVALNTQGLPLPVRGSLSLRLWGQRSKSYGWPLKSEELQRWTQSVHRDDFAESEAIYALRFRTVRPEFDFELRPYALLNARLSIHGQGNFEASVPVAVRYFNPVRDYLQQYEGSRFFFGELSENVRREIRPGREMRSR
ncbi:MAG: hypothetical protein MK171_03800 [Pirellulales bacterium]|nr:hypothetical protein [Pirellulales bacterium]